MREFIFSNVLRELVSNKVSRNYLLKKLDSYLYSSIVENDTKTLQEVQKKKYRFMNSMLKSAVRNVEKGYFSKAVFKRIIHVLVENSFLNRQKYSDKLEEFREQHGEYPPNFIVLSPTQRCNLNCTGCYASSNAHTTPTLPYHVVDRIVSEVRDKFHSRFVTISGGEPFMYKSEGKTLLDLFEKYDDVFFLVYTNGTLITPEIADRLGRMGNVTPSISVEGFEKETDERRGKGTHKKIMQAFENLRNAGVPIGISVTATSKNADLLLSDDFYDYYFDQQGATYMWQFQLMPMGRSTHDFDLMVPPQKRVELYRKWEYLISEKEYCVADFWNSGVLVNGCIAYGRRGGYIYIDWNGNIMPCVFVPYYVDNIYDLFNKNKTLVDALFSGFMKKGRQWIRNYGQAHPHDPENWLMPCSIRDHYANFRENILPDHAKGESKEAEETLKDDEYYKRLVEYDQELEELTEDIWEKEYKKKEKEHST
ncbi:MAG TPA: radical SAM/SPASM domain-containing protein [Bacteroidales bacterium]|nr:radical SAM/SPASM domain-containing protein [Bacteroidales bacterium]